MIEITDEQLNNLPQVRHYIERKLRSDVFIECLPDSIRWLWCSLLAGYCGATVEDIMSELEEWDLDVPQFEVESALIELRGRIEPGELPPGILAMNGVFQS